MKRGLQMFNIDSNFARHIWELVDSILWRVALEVTVKNWPPVQLSHLRSNFDLGTFGSLLLLWSWNPNQTSNDWVVPTLTLEATNVSEWWSKVPYWTLNDWVAPILSLEANFVQWPPRLFSIKSYQLVPNVPEWWSWNPNWTSNDWVAPVLTLEASFVLWPLRLFSIKSKQLAPKCASMVKLES